jgi:hypothetical protein
VQEKLRKSEKERVCVSKIVWLTDWHVTVE